MNFLCSLHHAKGEFLVCLPSPYKTQWARIWSNCSKTIFCTKNWKKTFFCHIFGFSPVLDYFLLFYSFLLLYIHSTNLNRLKQDKNCYIFSSRTRVLPVLNYFLKHHFYPKLMTNISINCSAVKRCKFHFWPIYQKFVK